MSRRPPPLLPLLWPRWRRFLGALLLAVGASWVGAAWAFQPIPQAVVSRVQTAAAQSPLRPAGVVFEGLRDDPQMSFGHYTFAVMWLPGLCQTWSDIATVCAAQRGSPSMRQFTLHGLWPSRPRELVEQGTPPLQWWRTGCYRYSHDNAVPNACALPALPLPPSLRQQLETHMPLTATCLDRHEYTKHIACFGPTPQQFSTAALDLLHAVNASGFSRWVHDHAGQTVSRKAIERAYARSFGLPDARSLQLQCESSSGHSRRDVFAQAYLTIATDHLAEFPAPAAFAPGRRGNCAPRVFIAPGPGKAH